MTSAAPILEARNLCRRYPGPRRWPLGPRSHQHAVSAVNLSVAPGEILGLIGESGSGKSTIGRLMLGLERPDTGQVLVDGHPMPQRADPAWRQLRRQLQVVFQDPHGALDPRKRILDQVTEPLDIFAEGTAAGRQRRAQEMLARVGLRPSVFTRFPNALSGGQKQRVVIARALMLSPRFLLCDEPISALDVSVGAQITALLADLHRDHGMAMLVVSHDLSMVRSFVHRVAVLFAGRVVEEANVATLFAAPRHPYTRMLIDAVPIADPTRRRPRQLPLPMPPPAQPAILGAVTGGCAFAARCPHRQALCLQKMPILQDMNDARPGHRTACHFPNPKGAAQ
ncbi:ATP-binding cassette domain-containing protein [Marinovum sp. 2_MG-2023]|uniref:oligopeptide/dipeptide ABC transporter ATP-binding protein n=1 Tax=unclassified Marinovum TaxID=2647166 RepID=UPI0026E18763|nr:MULTISPECIES: oligopeptide/dipeptide ABC transporter ATP-binding protein [unclassified Marinovum]MDO6730937.1 ATP-binding cassette domain-containing protein [Marinovum sp. 2_MG-2023]MDO6780164.1 ATP-binding cassette domain-containing protein [Marinovum sp. 1_MG-2023]